MSPARKSDGPWFFRNREWALLLAAVLTGCSKPAPPPAPPPPEVTVMKVSTTPVTVNEEYVAQTEATDPVEIRARVNGVLERQGFADGDRVRKNDLLFVIDQQPYIVALAQAKAALAQAQAAHVNSSQTLGRLRPLLADQAVSKQDVDTAIAKERADAASVDAARAAVKQAELNLGYTTIRAPRDGVISKALVKPGGLVTATQTLLTTMYSVDPIYANFTISEMKLLELQQRLKRNPGEDKSKAPPFRIKLADGSDYKSIGRLNFVDAAVDPKSGTLQVRISLPNPDRSLRPGQFVRVVVPAQENADGIRIPQRAVQELQGKRSVFVVEGDKAVYREIVANRRVDNDWVVEGGLKPGEMVVIEGIQKVRPGAPVKPVLVSAPGGPAANAQNAPPPDKKSGG